MVDGSLAERALAERRMREVNEAWHVLKDPVRRRRYDDGRIATTSRSRPGTTRPAPPSGVEPRADDDDLVEILGDVGPVQAGLFRHGPWAVLVVVLGLIFVVTAYAASDKTVDAPARADAGSCVNVASGPVTTVVPCSGPHELRIVQRVPEGADCPTDTEKRRLGSDGYLDCVRSD